MSVTLSQVAPEKPKWGEKCNGCGFCCAAETCDLAVSLMGATEAPCPAMEFDEGHFWCGMVRKPSRYLGTPDFIDASLSKTFELMLGIGRGCDAEDTLPAAKEAR